MINFKVPQRKPENIKKEKNHAKNYAKSGCFDGTI